MKLRLTLFSFFVFGVTVLSQPLPKIYIDTMGGTIVDDPKITAKMLIADNKRIDYDNYIGIELRGNSSQAFFPKKSYGIETRDSLGNDIKVSLLGFPAEADWVLYATYTDKTTIRNNLMYYLSNKMGHYASRTKYVEVYLNGEYNGLYVLMERIKRDKNRVNIAKLDPNEISGDNLTGGYLFRIDRPNGSENGWNSSYKFSNNATTYPYYEYQYPKPENLVAEQKTYIQNYMYNFETKMKSNTFNDDQTGYPALIDMNSFADYYILNELSNNVDGYRLSTYLYKDINSVSSRLVAGPVWDYDIALGNANYGDGASLSNFRFNYDQTWEGLPFPFWWPKIANDAKMQNHIKTRWEKFKNQFLHPDSVSKWVYANLPPQEAIDSNYVKWPIIGEWVWPNAKVFQSFSAEVGYMLAWYNGRYLWLDKNWKGTAVSVDDNNQDKQNPFDFKLTSPYPNPFNPETFFTVESNKTQNFKIELYSILGQKINTVFSGNISENTKQNFTISGRNLTSGIYFLKVSTDRKTVTKKMVLMK